MDETVIWWLDEMTLNDAMVVDELVEAGESRLPLLPGHIRNALEHVFKHRHQWQDRTLPYTPVINATVDQSASQLSVEMMEDMRDLSGKVAGIRIDRHLSGFIKHYPGVITDEYFNILKSQTDSTRIRIC